MSFLLQVSLSKDWCLIPELEAFSFIYKAQIILGLAWFLFSSFSKWIVWSWKTDCMVLSKPVFPGLWNFLFIAWDYSNRMARKLESATPRFPPEHSLKVVAGSSWKTHRAYPCSLACLTYFSQDLVQHFQFSKSFWLFLWFGVKSFLGSSSYFLFNSVSELFYQQ